MISLGLVVGIVVGAIAIIVVVIVLPYALGSARNRKYGSRGVVQHSRLTCPNCGRVFDYDWVPGAALTAVRLGKSRFMACPLCHHWSTFNIWDAPGPPEVSAMSESKPK
jgi:hypothetical protein